MDTLDTWFRQARDILSLMVDPWIELVGRVLVLVHRQMDDWNIAPAWQTPLITAVTLIEVALVCQFLNGWLRLILLAITALTALRVYGLA